MRAAAAGVPLPAGTDPQGVYFCCAGCCESWEEKWLNVEPRPANIPLPRPPTPEPESHGAQNGGIT